MEKAFYAHETSLVHPDAKIGKGTNIWQFCNIMSDVEIGENCNIGQNVFAESGVRIGNKVKVKNNVALYNGVVCEDNVFLGPNCVFTNVINPRSFIEKKDQLKKTYIKEGATIGANVTIVCGNEIGRYALVGAGSVVTRDIADYELVVGNPAKHIGYVCWCGETLLAGKEQYYCRVCGKEYSLENNKLIIKEKNSGIY